jgi:two-component system, NtrC family, response regulator AtoC
MTEIAIVDDEKVVLKSLQIGLSRCGYTVATFSNISTFTEYLKDNEPDMVFLDLQLPDGHGLEVLQDIMCVNRNIPTIIITAHGDITSAVQAMKLGAFDYISKPFDLDVIELLVVKACKERKLVREVEHHRNRSHQRTTVDDIIGNSPPMQELFAKMKQLGRVDATTVLLLGESGTGKDLLAKAIHNQSSRKEQQFIEINCAALPEQLLESELFGHERGAFTDAKNLKVGLAELADGGTLFLDEVGELPLPLQAKLLKFLETKTFRRIGGTSELKVDLFIIASTNSNLEQCVADKTFREDLYYRLSVVPLTMPPLRARAGDIALLVSHYWEVFTHKFHKRGLYISQEVREALMEYTWPGNIRELKNLLEQLVILSNENGVYLDDLPNRFLKKLASPSNHLANEQSINISESMPCEGSLSDAVDALEINTINQAMRQSGGVKAKAAQKLGISRYALLRKLKRFGLFQE